ncbi:MAG: TIGR03915 family putative DNA repair protein [Croceitalea sp.]|nr:TIGR03915 family putative DNA repair protein [Croceitalea sp.]
MATSKTYVYDGSFNGFLTLVYRAFDAKAMQPIIQKSAKADNELFTQQEYVVTNLEIAKLVWNGITKKNHLAIKRIYFAFLSEANQIEQQLFVYIKYVMGVEVPEDFEAIKSVIAQLTQLCDKVEREKKRTEAFVQFQLTQDQTYMVQIKPKYNVLPLLSKYLKHKNPGRHWQVYDTKRKCGLSYAFGKLELVNSSNSIKQAV